MTTPTEFVLWLNGAVSVMNDYPTPDQWAAIKRKLNESVGFLATSKLMERAEDQGVRNPANMYPGQPSSGPYDPTRPPSPGWTQPPRL
jgi:hypothetical protein